MTERGEGARAVTVVGPGGRADLLCPASATVGLLARAYADLTRQPTAPLLYARDGVPLAASTTLAGACVTTGAVLVATTGVVRGPRPADDLVIVTALSVGGGGRRRGRRRRDVVSTRDGTRQGDPVDGGGPGG